VIKRLPPNPLLDWREEKENEEENGHTRGRHGSSGQSARSTKAAVVAPSPQK
jgi:hypothetical protein